MLRLEKARNNDIHISLRRKEFRLNRPFLYAFAIACSMHLFAVLIFHIHSYISFGEILLPPSTVEIDLSSLNEDFDQGIMAFLEGYSRQNRHLLEPRASVPATPKMPLRFVVRQVEHIKDQNQNQNPFLAIEENWDHLLSADSNQKPQPFIKMQISGPLADTKIKEDGLQEAFAKWKVLGSLKPFKQQHLIVYTVQVESKTGKIFWYMPKQLAPDNMLNQMAEKILNEIRFQENPTTFVCTGDIEIAFTLASYQG